MLFNSSIFILLFLPATLLALYGFAAKGMQRTATAWLVLASCVFYGWFSTKLLLLLGVSIIFNFHLGRKLARDHLIAKRPVLLAFGITLNLAVLAYFKYANFLIDNVNSLTGTHFVLQNILLPIGISFFTFQKIAYLVDCHRGEAEEYNFLDFSLFVMYFPQLIAGPIVHHKEIIPQFRRPGVFRFSHDNFAAGTCLFVMGLVKKVLIADGLVELSDPIFTAAKAANALTTAQAWGGALAFNFQIYFDFSGYTDMALGLALMTGIRLPLNFNSPYKAASIIDFWHRWHISLSRFIREYLYIPLGGNRHGSLRRYANLMAAMLIGGLWHGAAWTFVIWGGLHGLYLVANHGWRTLRGQRHTSGDASERSHWLARILTFVAVVVAWVFFRAEGFPAALTMLQAMTGTEMRASAPIALPIETTTMYAALGGLLIWVWFVPNSQEILKRVNPTLSPGAVATPSTGWCRVLGGVNWTGPDGTLVFNAMTGSAAALVLIALLIHQAMRSTTLLQFIYFQF